MKTIAIVKEKETALMDLEMPELGPNQIMIAIKGCAICTWEQRIFDNKIKMPLPFLGGHEIAGEVVNLGESINPANFPVGSRVAVRLLTRCGKCHCCRSGADNLCLEIRNPYGKKETSIPGPGGMSEYISVDACQVYRMPDDIPFERIVFTEPLGCVLNSIAKAQIQMGDDVVVMGGGVMGLLHVICAKLSGARVILSEPELNRRNKAKELGADIVFDPLKKDPVDYINEITDGKGVEAVFNTVTPKIAVSQGIGMTTQQGRFIMFGLVIPNEPVEVDFNKLHDAETIVTGALSPSSQSFYQASNMLAKNIIMPDEVGLLSGVYDYSEADEAFEESLMQKNYRIMIKF